MRATRREIAARPPRGRAAVREHPRRVRRRLRSPRRRAAAAAGARPARRRRPRGRPRAPAATPTRRPSRRARHRRRSRPCRRSMRVDATERLRARELEFADLKRFFPPQIIDQVMARGGAAELGSSASWSRVLFADLRGFTSFSDSVEPEEVIATLDEYHTAMGARIAEFRRHARALRRRRLHGVLQRSARSARPRRARRAHGPGDARRRRAACAPMDAQGLQRSTSASASTAGYATCGFVGYEGRRDYAVIGNVTNLAARLSDAAAPGEILISARSYGELRRVPRRAGRRADAQGLPPAAAGVAVARPRRRSDARRAEFTDGRITRGLRVLRGV